MIRPWVLSDNDAVEKIERESFSDPWSKKMLDDCFLTPVFQGLVWEEDGQVCGYVGMLIPDDGEIALIAVDKKFRRRGIGEKLLSSAVSVAKEKGAQSMFLEVRTSNLSAQGLYKKAGFIPIAIRKKYYSNGEDAIVMVLPITCEDTKEEK